MANYHQPGALKPQKLCLTILKARSPKSRSQLAMLTPQPLREEPSLLLPTSCNPNHSLAYDKETPVSASVLSWPSFLRRPHHHSSMTSFTNEICNNPFQSELHSDVPEVKTSAYLSEQHNLIHTTTPDGEILVIRIGRESVDVGLPLPLPGTVVASW